MAKERHWGITVLGVLAYIGAVFTAITGLALVFGANAIVTYLANIMPVVAARFAGVGLIVLGLFFIACAVLDYFIGRGMFNGQNWSRIVVIILFALSILGSLAHPFRNLVGIVMGALVIWYLAAYKPAVDYFR